MKYEIIKKKILFISSFLPSKKADSAGVLDAAYLFNELSNNNDLTLMTNYTISESNSLEDIAKKCKKSYFIRNRTFENKFYYYLKTFLSYFTALPAIAFMATSLKFHFRLKRILREDKFDLIILEFTQSLVFLHLLPFGSKIVIDESDIAFIRRQRYIDNNFSGLKKKMILIDNRKLKRFEISNLNKCNKVLLRTKADKDLLINNGFNPKILTHYYLPWIELNNGTKIFHQLKQEVTILFYAAMWRPVNQEAAIYFVNEILPYIAMGKKNISFYIVGSRPSEAIKKLSSENIIVTGFVESIEPYYNRSSVVVAPLLSGSGIKGKIIQALSYGKPVVTTSVGAEGLEELVSSCLIVENDNVNFANKVLNLIENPPSITECDKISQLVNEKYNWENNIANTINFMFKN